MKLPTVQGVNMATIWTMLTGTVICVGFMFTHFASAKDLKDLKQEMIASNVAQDVSAAYGQFYDRLDDYDEAIAEGNGKLAEEYKRQMEKWRALICKHDEEWERCDD